MQLLAEYRMLILHTTHSFAIIYVYVTSKYFLVTI